MQGDEGLVHLPIAPFSQVPAFYSDVNVGDITLFVTLIKARWIKETLPKARYFHVSSVWRVRVVKLLLEAPEKGSLRDNKPHAVAVSWLKIH